MKGKFNKTAGLYRIIILFAPLIFACNNSEPSKDGSAAAQPPPTYAILTVKPMKTTLFTDFPATIQGQQNIEIRPKIDGYVERIYVDEGATVTQGQRLFHISAPQYEQELRTAQADIKIAQADVNAAQMQVNKVRPLVEKNIISSYELQSAEYTFQSRRAALAQAQARLANANINLGYTTVTSPVSGIVGPIPFKIGSLVSSNNSEPLTTISNVSTIYAYFSVNEKQALAFQKSTPGSTSQERLATLPPVTLILADGSEFPQKGKVESGSGIVNTQTGSFSLRATFPNPGNIIRSGSTGTVRIPQEEDSALIIPQKATYEIQGKKFVYVLDSANSANSVEIEVIESGNGQFFVVKEGLLPGDIIVLEGVATLRDGTRISPKNINVDSVYNKLPD